MTEAKTHTLEAPGAVLHYDVRSNDASTEPVLGHNMVPCNHYRHDFDALRAAPTRVVVGVGTTSGDQLPGRAAVVVADQLGTAPVTFPGDHGGFLGGEYGQTGEPDAFAATLREVLAG